MGASTVVSSAKAPILGGLALALGIGLSCILVAPDGERLFREEGCANCHRFRGRGGSMGPDLTGVSNRRSTRWIMAQIRNPSSLNPDSRMPGYPHLSVVERYVITHYLGADE